MRIKTMLSISASALVGAGVGYKIGLFHQQPQFKDPTLDWVTGKNNLPPETDWNEYAARTYNNVVISERVTEGYISPSSLRLLQKANQLDPNNHTISVNRIFAMLNIADQELNADNTQAADELISQAQQAAQQSTFTKDNRHFTFVLYGLGYAYQRRATVAKEYNDKKSYLNNAVDTYKKAFQEKPNKIAACLAGEAYMDLTKLANEFKHDSKSEVENSIQWFQKAISMDSEYGLAYFRAGQACILAGRVNEAKSHFTTAFTIYTKDPKAFAKEYQKGIDYLFNDVPEFTGREDFVKPFSDNFGLSSNVTKRI